MYKVKSNGTEHNLVEEKETYISNLTSGNITAQSGQYYRPIKYTVTENGYYLLYAHAQIQTTSTSGISRLLLERAKSDGSTVVDSKPVTYAINKGEWTRLGGTAFFNCEKGDILWMAIYQNGGYGEVVSDIKMSYLKIGGGVARLLNKVVRLCLTM